MSGYPYAVYANVEYELDSEGSPFQETFRSSARNENRDPIREDLNGQLDDDTSQGRAQKEKGEAVTCC